MHNSIGILLGAGTCLEILEKNKPLVVVINEELMHNHQTELATKLAELGYCEKCTCRHVHWQGFPIKLCSGKLLYMTVYPFCL